jgi:hypothetical protein
MLFPFHYLRSWTTVGIDVAWVFPHSRGLPAFVLVVVLLSAHVASLLRAENEFAEGTDGGSLPVLLQAAGGLNL